MRAILLASVFFNVGAGCSWTSFDDIAKEATVQSTKDPSVGSSNFAMAIVDTGTGIGGGQLSVLSNDQVTYTNLVYDTKGGSSVINKIVVGGGVFVAPQPALFVANSPTECTAVCVGTESATNTIVEFKGCASPPGTKTLQVSTAPDGAAYVGTTLVIASGSHLYVDGSTGVLDCTANDDAASPAMVTGFAGLGGNTDTLFGWTQDGKLLTYGLTDLLTCPSLGTPAAPVNAMAGVATGFSAAPAANVIVSGNFAVLAGLAPSSTTGKVVVVDVSGAPAVVGSGLDANGVRSAALGELGGGGTFLALGFPDASTGGQVQIYPFDTATGALGSVMSTLADAQPDSGEAYGRSVAIMKYNSSTILTVAAKSEVFAYFALDPIYSTDLRQK